jgi:predicted DNA-binding transcriptional regulator AlpA
MQSKLLTLQEVAQRYPIPEATLRYWRHRGDVGPKSARIGRRVVYLEADVEAWIAAQFAADRGAA